MKANFKSSNCTALEIQYSYYFTTQQFFKPNYFENFEINYYFGQTLSCKYT